MCDGRLLCAVAAAAFLCISPAVAQGVEHAVSDDPASNGPVSASDIETRLDKAAQADAKIGQVERFVDYDLALPRDAGEYSRLGGYGVVLLIAISHDSDELPLRKVYIRSGGHDTPLRRLYRVADEPGEATAVRSVFGQYREYEFFLVPVGLAISDHQLLCDFAAHRDGFAVGSTPEDPPFYLNPQLYQRTGGTPSKAQLRDFIKREWPGIAPALSEDKIE